MASILDNVKKNLGAAAVTPDLEAQQQVQTLARATTGKAVGSGTAPALSEQGQAAVAQDTMVAQRAQQVQQKEIAAQLGTAEKVQDTQFQTQKKQLRQKEIGIREQSYQRTNAMLDQMSQSLEQLDFDKTKAQQEQVGFLLRLNNEKYIDRLQINGRKSRLNDEVEFKEALQRAIFAEEADLFKKDLHFKTMLNMDERQFKQELTELNLEQWLEVAEMESDAANARAKFEAIGNIVGGVTQIGASAAASGAFKSSSKPTTGTTLQEGEVPMQSAAKGPESEFNWQENLPYMAR